MRIVAPALLGLSAIGSLTCAGRRSEPGMPSPAARPSLAQVYFWRARPGKLDEYNRYIREVAEPIDQAAQRGGAFLSVFTYVSRDTTTPWTHMRVFLLRDSVQLAGLGPALDSAGMRVEPDSARRRMRSEYAATLRDRVGSATVEILR
jgi:hypothetical protein